MAAEHNEKEAREKLFEWRSFLFGFFLALLLFVLKTLSGFGSTVLFVNNTPASPQTAAAVLAAATDPEGDTLVVEERLNEAGEPIIGLWVGEASIVVAPVPPVEEDTGAEDTDTITQEIGTTTQTGAPSLQGPWYNHWWRGPDQPSDNDPTPGVPKVYEVPIQGAGGGGSSGGGSSSDSGGSSGDSGGDGGGDSGGGDGGGAPGIPGGGEF